VKHKSYRNSRKEQMYVARALPQRAAQDIADENESLRNLIQSKLGLSAQEIEQELNQLRQLQTNTLLRELVKEKLHLQKHQIDATLEHARLENKSDITIPVSTFRTSLSTLEVVVQFLKNSSNLQLSEIAALLNRDHRTVWHAYQRSQKKAVRPATRAQSDVQSDIQIPILIFADRKNSPLEALAAHLHQTHSLPFAEIGRMLLLSRKTVWTVYQRFTRNAHA